MGFESPVIEPLNREPPIQELVSSFITESGGYDRNHSEIPYINAQKHIVLVNGAVRRPLLLTIDQLRRCFHQHEVVCAVACAGNRRHTMRTLIKEVQGIDWNDGAIMNCAWKGPRVKDVLNEAGVDIGDWKTAHVEFACHQAVCQQDAWYGVSLELNRVVADDSEIIFALEMNGKPLPPAKGHPIRLIAPGIYGCRSVKWLDRITVQPTESRNFYQQRDYKILPPEAVDSATAAPHWNSTPAMNDMAINSIIAIPQSGDTVALVPSPSPSSTSSSTSSSASSPTSSSPSFSSSSSFSTSTSSPYAGTIEAKGYAVPQGDQGPVIRVEVSIDEGETWTDAELLKSPPLLPLDKTATATETGAETGPGPGPVKWSWTLWRASIPIEHGTTQVSIFSRATDSGGNTQPAVSPWNLRGVGYNGYGRAVGVKILC